MATIAEFTLRPDDFPLGAVFDAHPDATLELDRVVPNDDTVMPYFWVTVSGGDLEYVLGVFEGLAELRSVTLMDRVDDSGLFRAEWDPAYLGIMRAVAEAGVTVLAASGSSEGWRFELRAASSERLAAFQTYCRDHDIDVTLTRLHSLSELPVETGTDLTPEQHEALALAYHWGYYDEPRRTDLQTLADHVGITRQAFSARLRRGYRALLERAVVTNPETLPTDDQ